MADAGASGLQLPLRFVQNWPAPHGGVGKRIAEAEAVPGVIRHELILEKTVLGKLIGPAGTMLKELQGRTGAGIFVVDKEVPPGFAESQRLVVLIGSLAQCEQGTIAVFSTIEGATGAPQSQTPSHQPSHAPQQPPPVPVAPSTSGVCTRLVANWPPPHGGTGKRIAEAEVVPGVVRHEILLEKHTLGKLIGPGGAQLKELCGRTQTGIFVCDKEVPPGYGETQRLVVIIGAESLVLPAAAEVYATVEGSRASNAPTGFGAGRAAASPSQPQQSYSYADASAPRGFSDGPPAGYVPPAAPVQIGTTFTASGTELTRYVSNWPPPMGGVGRRIAEAEATPGVVRHEVLLDRMVLGKLIGPGGSKLKEIMAQTGCGVYVCDKDPPPGHPENQRLVVLIGSEATIAPAMMKIFETVESAGHGNGAGAGAGAGGYNGGAMMGGGGGANRDAAPLVGGGYLLPQFRVHVEGWPTQGPDADRISSSLAAGLGRVRHDMVVPKAMVGRIIGPQGAQKKELRHKTNADIYVIDDEAPPRESADKRLVALCGTPLQVSAASLEIDAILRGQDTPLGGARGPGGMPSPNMWSPMGGMGMGAMGMNPYMPQMGGYGGAQGGYGYGMGAMGMGAMAGGYSPMLGMGGPSPVAPPQPPLVQQPLIELTRLVASDWPPAGMGGTGARIATAEAVPGVVRHEILLEKQVLGKLIGPGGSALKELQARTACGIFVCDKEIPPGFGESQRIVVLVGAHPNVSNAAFEVNKFSQLPPPPAKRGFSDFAEFPGGMPMGMADADAKRPNLGMP